MKIGLAIALISLPILGSGRAAAQSEAPPNKEPNREAEPSGEAPPNGEVEPSGEAPPNGEVEPSGEAPPSAETTDREPAPSPGEQERKLTKPPALLVDSPAEYPKHAADRIDTAVVLALTIDERGAVTEALVKSSPQPGFDEAALHAARALRFSPAEIDGKPAAVRVTFRYNFAAPAPVAEKEPTPEPGQPKPKVPPKDAAPRPQEGALEVVVRGEGRSSIGVAELRPSEGGKVAGSLGDGLNAVQSLPGVSAAPSGSGEISVWGATPEETRVYIDGVPVPALYHRGGYRSVIHEGLVERVTMTPAAYGPEHGRALGGIVQVETKRMEGEGTHGQLGADFIGAQALIQTEPRIHTEARASQKPHRDKHTGSSFGAMGAGRVGYLDVLLPKVAPEVEQVIPLSAYRDYAGKLRLAESPRGYTEVSVFGAFDAVERRQPTADPTTPSSEQTRESFHRLAVRHNQISGAHEDRLGVWLGLDQSELTADFSDVGTRSATQNYRYGASASRSTWVTDSFKLTLGAELEGQHTLSERQGTLGLPAREGDIVAFGQSPATQVGSDEFTTDILGVGFFSGADIHTLRHRFIFSPSLRLEPIVQMGDQLLPANNTPAVGYSRLDLAVSPRLALKANPLDRLSLQAAGSLVHQPAPPEDRSAVFGGTDLGLSHAGHGLVGAVIEVERATTIELTGFSKYGWDLVVRNPIEPPPVAAALVNAGSSRTYGGQVLLRGKPHPAVSGWMTYTLSRAERRQSASSAWRPSDFDQRHLFTVVANVELSQSWNVGARARAASGLPRTEVTGAYYDARLDAYQPRFGEHNRDPLPFSFQLDLHAEWTERFASNAVTLYLDVVNVTNQKNAIERTYNYDYSQSGYLRSLPLLAVFGGRWDF